MTDQLQPDGAEKSKLYLREWRKSREWTNVELARRVGTSTTTVSNLENELRHFKGFWLDRFAAVFECTPGDLLGPPDEAGPKTDVDVALLELVIETAERAFVDEDMSIDHKGKARIFALMYSEARERGELDTRAAEFAIRLAASA